MDDLICDDRDAEIVKAIALGYNERAIARRYQITVREVRAAVDRLMIQINRPHRSYAARRQLERIEVMARPYMAAALAGETAAASVMIKLMEREASILALDQPMRVDAMLIEPAERTSSTDDLEAAINLLIGKPAAQSH
ncbi:hypothetical protein [Bradyrhizobium sp. 27S5]|uniref:hypothetical protein n=1 Tax=Bradyrhizobium sp. 27S5 TaxID=3139728 RepID=UPI0030CEC858